MNGTAVARNAKLTPAPSGCRVRKEAKGPRELRFDVYIHGYRVARVWMEIDISSTPSDRGTQNKTISSPRTAFASYASADRLRVLDRVASLEIHSGLLVFLDCVTMRPNSRWREVLPEMVRDSDQLLLFWSPAARDSG